MRHRFSAFNNRNLKLICLLVFFLSVCTFSVQATENPEILETVNLQLKWKHQFQYAGYYAAIAQGYYAQEGLEVQIHETQFGSSVEDLIAAGKVEYGVADVGALFSYAQGKPVRALAAFLQHNPLVFLSKKSSGIVKPADFLGKQVMLRSIMSKDALLKVLLMDSGISENQFVTVKYNYQVDDLVSGKVDVMSGHITKQPFDVMQKGFEVNIIRPINFGIDFYGDLLITNLQELQQHKGRSERFLRASKKGWKYAFEHPEELVQLIKNHYKSPMNLDRLRFEAEETRKLVLPDIIPLGEIKVSRLGFMADIFSRLNLARELSDYELEEFINHKTNKLNLTEKELEWIKNHPVIRLGVDRNFPPYEWIDEQGIYKGIAAEYSKIIEQRLGVQFDVVKDKNTWGEVLNAAKAGEFDMLSCLVKTPEREDYLNFSESYLNSSAVIISEQLNGYLGSLSALAGKSVAIQKGHYTLELLAKNHPEIKLITTDNIENALKMVSEGQAFAYVGDASAASFVLKKEGFLNLMFSGSTPYTSQYHFATSKKNHILASIINKTLATVSQDERDKILTRWQSFTINKGIDVIVVFKVALVAIGLLYFFAYWIYRLRRSEQALKTSEEKLQLILDNAPECVKILDSSGDLLQMNPAGLRMIGVKEVAQVIGKPVEDLILNKYKAAFRQMNERVLSGESCTLEFQIKSTLGEVKWVESSAVPLVDSKNHTKSILALARDITERKRTEEALKIAGSVYENTSEAIMVLDNQDRIIAINPAFQKITGYNFDEIAEKTSMVLRAKKQNKKVYQQIQQGIAQSGQWEGEVYNKHKNGNEFIAWLIINTIYTEQGEILQRVALFSDITEKKRAEKQLWEQANYDPLTGLPNRSMFLGRLDQDIKGADRSNKTLAVVFLDLDHFKEVNDVLGHDKGDELLCEAAKRLTACVRESDTVARFGGDEFVIIMTDLEGAHSIDRVAQEIIVTLSEGFQLTDELSYVSASLGIALYPNDADTTEDLLKHADQAMYLSKETGRGRFSYFTPSMQEHAQYRQQILHDLRNALLFHQFELYYQPIVDLQTGLIVKAEALVRWNHPEKGIVSPVDFISLAEESGMIIELGDWVFKQAAQQIKHWKDTYNKYLQVSINKSPVQFRAASDRDDWLLYLKKIGLDGDSIVIEITEGLLMDTSDNIRHQLLQYRDANIQVAMDDFGTGYSALSYLNKFHIDFLKIDQSFTRNLAVGSSDMALSEAIILMAHKLGLKVIAEGIETEEQKSLLLQAKCNYGQGYLFSKPVPADQFEALLASQKI